MSDEPRRYYDENDPTGAAVGYAVLAIALGLALYIGITVGVLVVGSLSH